MLDVAILGAGELGGAIAHTLARCDVAASIRLVDESGQIAAGKALDIMQAAPIEGFTTRVSGTRDLFAAGGASLFVVADRADGTPTSSTEWQGDEGLGLLQRIGQMAHREEPILCAGAGQRALVERAARELHLSRARLFGSAPEALAGAIRAFVALEANVSPSDVALMVLGIPPSQVVIPWGESTIAGMLLTRTLDEPACRRLAARVGLLWPPGPRALAAAAVKAIESVAGKSRQMVSCFVAPDDTNGRRTRAIALPARLGPGGIVRAEVPSLDTHDRVKLDNAMLL